MPRWTARHAIAFVVVVALLGASCSGDTSGSEASSNSGDSSGDAVEVFEPSVVHSIEVEFDQTDYDEMIQDFEDTGEKNWIEATVTIDGATYDRVGLRLKGNSSLMGLRRTRMTGAPGTGADTSENQDAAPAAPNGARGFPGGIGGGATADDPEQLPWLIRFDEYVPDQEHQGYADIVVRSNSSATSLNEAVALDLIDATSLASQQAISTTFSVNGAEPVLRLAIEHPDDDAWQDRVFDSPGALYKAESTGDWSYRGDAPESYAEIFDQEGGKKVADLTPLIEFLEFLDESDDQTFTEELPERLDVESFATYLALMELLENFDDIDGPGNNAYLWWDADTEQFTIVPWDMNLAFGQLGAMMGGGPPGGFDPSEMPDGFPEGAQPPGGGGPNAGGGIESRFGRDNALVQRFLANAEFQKLYQDRLASLRADLFDSGAAETVLDARVETLKAAPEVIDTATVENEASSLRERFTATATGSV